MGAGCPRAIDDITPQITQGTVFHSIPADLLRVILVYSDFGNCLKIPKKYRFKTTWQVPFAPGHWEQNIKFLAIEPSTGNIFASDIGLRGHIHVLDPDGKYLRSFPFDSPGYSYNNFARGCMTFLKDGTLVIVGGWTRHATIHFIDPRDGTQIRQITPEEISTSGICTTRSGDLALLISQYGHWLDRPVIQLMSPEGNIFKTIQCGSVPVCDHSIGLAIDPRDGTFLVSSDDEIHFLSEEGECITSIGRLGQAETCGGVVIDGTGNIVVCTNTDSVVRFISREGISINAGVLCQNAKKELVIPTCVIIGKNGKLLAVNGSEGIHVGQ